jgi:hypothetical protein
MGGSDIGVSEPSSSSEYVAWPQFLCWWRAFCFHTAALLVKEHSDPVGMTTDAMLNAMGTVVMGMVSG